MSVKINARCRTAGEIKEAGADTAAGATQISTHPVEFSKSNHSETAAQTAAEPPATCGVQDTKTVSTDRGWPDPEALKKLPESDLAAAIESGYQTTRSAVHSAKQHNANALAGALRTGALLEEVHRRVGKSGFGPWMQKNCPALPPATAYRYKKLAEKFPHVRTDEEIVGLRQAYIAVGIIPEKVAAQKKKVPDLSTIPTPSGTDVLTRVQSNRAFLGAELARVNPTTMDAAARTALLGEINALIDQLSAVRETISRAMQMVVGDATTAQEKEAA